MVDSVDAAAHNVFKVGQLVNVESRTWPGINQPGGVGRVTGISADRVSVQYIVGRRREKEIPLRFIKAHSIEGDRLRNRTMLLGRCSNCGSLRTDCGSCDVWAEEHMKAQSSDSDDSSGLDEDLEEQKRRFRRYRRINARAQRILDQCDDFQKDERENEHEASGHSDDSSDGDSVLRKLVWQSKQHQVRARRASPSQTKRRRVILDDDSSVEVEMQQPMRAPCPSPSEGGSVSNPGTPDMSQNSRSHRMQEDVECDDSSPVRLYSGDEDDILVDEGETFGLTQDDFIQPEGNASDLPADVLNLAANVEYKNLPSFFDRLVENIETKRLPAALKLVEQKEAALAESSRDRQKLRGERLVVNSVVSLSSSTFCCHTKIRGFCLSARFFMKIWCGRLFRRALISAKAH